MPNGSNIEPEGATFSFTLVCYNPNLFFLLVPSFRSKLSLLFLSLSLSNYTSMYLIACIAYINLCKEKEIHE